MLYDDRNQAHTVKVVTVQNDHAFSTESWPDQQGNVFVLWQRVNDFRSVDFDQITALAIGAIQELNAQQKSDREAIQQLKAENEKLKAANAQQSEVNKTMKAQIDAISERLNITTGK